MSLTYLRHGAESFLRSELVCSQSRNSPRFMEPEGSLPHSQDSANPPYPGPTQIQSIYPHPTSWISVLILSTHLRLGLPSGLFINVSRRNFVESVKIRRGIFWGEIKHIITVIAIILFACNLTDWYQTYPTKRHHRDESTSFSDEKREVKNVRSCSKGTE